MIYIPFQTQSMSTKELREGEYENGDLVPLSNTTLLGQAIVSETWLNMDDQFRDHWLRELSSLRVKFAGTVISAARKQVELSLVYRGDDNETSHIVSFCISLANFERFL